MKDFLGQELQVNDHVIVAVTHGNNAGATLVNGIVTRFTEFNVFYIGSNYTGHYVKERKASPMKVVRNNTTMEESDESRTCD